MKAENRREEKKRERERARKKAEENYNMPRDTYNL
jgi:hypothetical protein